MNISPVNNISYNKTNSLNINLKQTVTKPLPFDSVSFTGKEKPSFWDKIKSLFGKNEDVEIELTEEERKDATIRGTFKGMHQAEREYRRVAKIEVKTLNTLLELGKLQDFKPYLPYEEGKKLLFGGFDENNCPTRLDIVNLKGGMSVDKSYDFNCNRSLFSTTMRYSQRSNTKLDIINGKPLHMVDNNYEDGSFQRMSFLDNAVHFMTGPLDKNGTSRIGQIAYYDYKDPEKCYFIDLDDNEDIYNYYKYNIEDNFWEVTKRMSFEEVQDFIQSQEF